MSASSFRGRWRYDVFVSFRGEDVRRKFVDHLFKDFKQKGIRAFRDDSELPKGEEISLELYKAIEESRFLLVIFSKDYASSSWCLRELVKILECKQTREPKHEIRIIFYDVKPGVVRKQTESYAVAFANYESSNRTEVAEWKEALTKAANLVGSDLQDLANGYEAKFIESISSEIFKKLCVGPVDVGENLVGVDARVEELNNMLHFVGSDKVHMIGICGMSGIGKTTLAKAIYNLLHVRFEASCFCDVQEIYKREGLTGAQMQLVDDILKTRDVKIYNVATGIMVIRERMSSKPILHVLDDVDHREQLEALAGSPDWFFPGSIIIFTCKDKKLLSSHHVRMIYDMPILPNREAFELFCLHAFGPQHPTDDFRKLAYQIVEHLQGHPLALKVLGGCLYEEPINIWKSQLYNLQIRPHADIQQKLRPSFNQLDIHQKRIFLDIACCFIGENKDIALNVLNDDDCSADVNFKVLVDKYLVTISSKDMSLQMHELIRSMAREIVFEERSILGYQSRLWGPSKKVYDVLSEDKVEAIEAVEVIVLLLKKSTQKCCIDGNVFTHMKKLRILQICYVGQEDLGKKEHSNVSYSGSLYYLSNKLRLLYWHGCPFKFLPSNFYPENMVAIDLSYSNIINLWTTPKCFSSLRVMKLKHCRNLISTPDFTHMTSLEVLILEGCVNLIKIHPSIGMLENLLVLNLYGCLKANILRVYWGKIKSLVELHIDQTAITKLPSFLFSLPKLVISSFGQHGSFWFRPLSIIAQPTFLPQSLILSSLAGLHSLQSLNISDCNILRVPDIGGLSCLQYLNLNRNDFTSLPGSLSQLSRLRSLHLVGCRKLEVFPELPPSIKSINADDCNILQVPENIGGLSCLKYLSLGRNNFTSLPGSLSRLSHLHSLGVSGCKKLELLPELPPNTERLFADDCPKLDRNVKAEIIQAQHLETYIISQGARDKLPSVLRFIDTRSNICEFFNDPKSEATMDMIFYGNRIPEWFKNQSMGREINVELPPDCYSKFRGYAFCVVITPIKFKRDYINLVVKFDGDDTLSIFLILNTWKSIGIPESDMIVLCYKRDKWRRGKKSKNYVSFSFMGRNEEVEVKKCGVRLVCDEEDLEEVKDASIINHYLSTTTQYRGYFKRYDYLGKYQPMIQW